MTPCYITTFQDFYLFKKRTPMGKLKKNSTKIAHSPRQFHQLKDLACPYTNQRRFCSHFSSTEMNKIKGRVMDTYYQA